MKKCVLLEKGELIKVCSEAQADILENITGDGSIEISKIETGKMNIDISGTVTLHNVSLNNFRIKASEVVMTGCEYAGEGVIRSDRVTVKGSPSVKLPKTIQLISPSVTVDGSIWTDSNLQIVSTGKITLLADHLEQVGAVPFMKRCPGSAVTVAIAHMENCRMSFIGVIDMNIGRMSGVNVLSSIEKYGCLLNMTVCKVEDTVEFIGNTRVTWYGIPDEDTQCRLKFSNTGYITFPDYPQGGYFVFGGSKIKLYRWPGGETVYGMQYSKVNLSPGVTVDTCMTKLLKGAAASVLDPDTGLYLAGKDGEFRTGLTMSDALSAWEYDQLRNMDIYDILELIRKDGGRIDPARYAAITGEYIGKWDELSLDSGGVPVAGLSKFIKGVPGLKGGLLFAAVLELGGLIPEGWNVDRIRLTSRVWKYLLDNTVLERNNCRGSGAWNKGIEESLAKASMLFNAHIQLKPFKQYPHIRNDNVPLKEFFREALRNLVIIKENTGNEI